MAQFKSVDLDKSEHVSVEIGTDLLQAGPMVENFVDKLADSDFYAHVLEVDTDEEAGVLIYIPGVNVVDVFRSDEEDN